MAEKPPKGSGRGSKRRQRTPELEPLIDELSDEDESERRDFGSLDRNLFESKHGPVSGSDGDDNPTYARAKVKFDGNKLEAGDISDPVQAKGHPANNLPGQIVADGHGFIVNDPRSRPWKTARRTRCAQCAGEMPPPDVTKYRCEFASDANMDLSRVGDYYDAVPEMAGGGISPPLDVWRRFTPAQRCHFATGNCEHTHHGCDCSGCTLRDLVASGHERNAGNPRKYCSDGCSKLADAERGRWKRAVASAEKRGLEPPPEPEDRGLKFIESRGLRSSVEGTGHRYIAATGGITDEVFRNR